MASLDRHVTLSYSCEQSRLRVDRPVQGHQACRLKVIFGWARIVSAYYLRGPARPHRWNDSRCNKSATSSLTGRAKRRSRCPQRSRLRCRMSSEFRAARAAFLGIERSLTGRRWAARLADERMALAMAQRHGLPDAICRLLAAREVDLEGVPDFLEPTLRKFLPDPSHLKDMDAAIARVVRAVPRGREDRGVRRLRRRWRHLVGAAGALLPGGRRQCRRLHSRPAQGRLRPQHAGAARHQGAGRRGRDHRRLRHHRLRAAGRGQARGPRPDRHRPSHGRDRAAAGGGGGRSQSPGRRQPAQADGGGRRGFPAGGRRQSRPARGRLVRRRHAPSPTCANGSTSWPWARCAMSCR